MQVRKLALSNNQLTYISHLIYIATIKFSRIFRVSVPEEEECTLKQCFCGKLGDVEAALVPRTAP